MPVFLCYASGKCNFFSIKELAEYILPIMFETARQYYAFLPWILILPYSNNWLNKNITLHYSNNHVSEPFYIYINQDGMAKYNISADKLAKNSLEEAVIGWFKMYSTLNSLNSIIRYKGKNTVWVDIGLYRKVSNHPKFKECTEPGEFCTYMAIRNKILHWPRRIEIQDKIQNGGKYITCAANFLFKNPKQSHKNESQLTFLFIEAPTEVVPKKQARLIYHLDLAQCELINSNISKFKEEEKAKKKGSSLKSTLYGFSLYMVVCTYFICLIIFIIMGRWTAYTEPAPQGSPTSKKNN